MTDNDRGVPTWFSEFNRITRDAKFRRVVRSHAEQVYKAVGASKTKPGHEDCVYLTASLLAAPLLMEMVATWKKDEITPDVARDSCDLSLAAIGAILNAAVVHKEMAGDE